MRIPLLILGSPLIQACLVRLPAGKYKFHFDGCTSDDTNIPAEAEYEVAELVQVMFTPSFGGRNVNIFAERLE